MFKAIKNRQTIIKLVIVIVFGTVGTVLVVLSHASTPSAVVEPESGQLRSDSKAVTDSTASGGGGMKFGPNAFVKTSGMNFTLDGRPYKWVGYNAYGMEGCYNGTAWTTAQMDDYFSRLPANGVTRIWAFRNVYGTSLGNTVLLRQILDRAAAHKQRIIMVLGDGNATCGETDYSNGDHQAKTAEFYKTGWQDQWLTWTNTVVPLFKNNPQILMWEMANEPGNPYFGTNPTSADWVAYFKGTSDAIRALDPNHLIGTGVNSPNRVNGANNYETIAKLPNIDAISFHDYAYERQLGAMIAGEGTTARQVATQANKPFYAGEAGVPAGPTCSDTQYTRLSLPTRLTYLKNKTDAYFANGIGGVLFWEYAPSRARWVSDCAYEMYPGDPMLETIKSYTIPS